MYLTKHNKSLTFSLCRLRFIARQALIFPSMLSPFLLFVQRERMIPSEQELPRQTENKCVSKGEDKALKFQKESSICFLFRFYGCTSCSEEALRERKREKKRGRSRKRETKKLRRLCGQAFKERETFIYTLAMLDKQFHIGL